MIFHLTNSLINQRNKLNQFHIFLTNIMSAHHEGKHIIVIEAINMKKLLEDPNIIANATLYKSLIAYSSRNKDLNLLNLQPHFNLFIEIIPFKSITKIKHINNIEYRYVYYDKFLDTADIQKTIILGENASDADIYKIFAVYYQNTKRYHLSSYTINFKKQGGGGNTVVNEYKTIYEDKENFCLCILDSDIKSPNKTKVGETADKVKKFHASELKKKNINLKIAYRILDTLELENLLPASFYIEHFEKKGCCIEGNFHKIKSLMEHDVNIRKYIDFKKGIHCITECDECKEYVKNYLCPLCKKSSLPLIDNKFLEPYGSKILDLFQKISIPDILKYVDDDILVKPHWENLGQYIASHILAPQKNRSI